MSPVAWIPPGAVAHAAEASGQLVVTAVVGDSTTPVDGFQEVFDAARLAGLPQDTTGATYLTATGGGPMANGRSGVTLRTLVPEVGVDAQSVGRIDLRSPNTRGYVDVTAGDLTGPGDLGFPFTNDAAPLVVTTGADLDLYVGQRTPASVAQHGRLANGLDFGPVGVGGTISVVLHLTTTLSHPEITTVDHPVTTKDLVSFEGTVQDVAPGNPLTWTWTFGDDRSATGASVSHQFGAAGTYTVTATVRGQNGSAGSATKEIVVTGPTTPPKTTSPPPTGPSVGVGNSTAPNNGPVNGTGPRVGGAPTDRSGTGGPGPTFDPRSVQPSVSNSASGGALAEGNVVGYLLSDGEAVAPAAQAAAKPLDDSAPAARDGVIGHDVAAWIVGALVVVALLAVGAGSERRRPARAGRRRPRGRV